MRVLFHYPVLNLGGAEKSVLRLIRGLLDRGCAVDLVLTTGGGRLECEVDPRATVYRLRERPAGHRFLSESRLRGKIRALPDLAAYAFYRAQEVRRRLPFRFRRYDAAVVSVQGLSPSFVCRWVKARKRFHFIRNDLAESDPTGKVQINEYATQMDAYLCVSRTAYDSLVANFPRVKEQAFVLYNLLDASSMRRLAGHNGDPYASYSGLLKVVTVCRLQDRSKGLLRMLSVHRRLRDEGVDYHWFVVGDGLDRERLEHAVAASDMGDRFHLMGLQANPYPYYRFADVAATLSYYEGLCGTVNEAKVLGKPLIATRFSGIEEQIGGLQGGLIVENDEDSIHEGMKRILTDDALRASLTNTNLSPAILDDASKVQTFLDLIEQA
jgi:glycosyltransferase involved in cell wall biosynthesis